MQLAGRCALITGANQGLGLAIAKQFIAEGASVMLCARNLQLLEQVYEELQPALTKKAKIFIQQADISSPEQVHQLVENTLKHLGKLDILVSNAGVYGTKGPLEEVDWEEWSRAIDINLKGSVLLCKETIPYFKKNKYGKIILLSGGGATKPLPYLSAYAASKAAVVRFGETLALELKDFNITVNTVAPGALNTRLLDEVLTAGSDKVGLEFYQQSLKQKQTGGTALSVGADLCVFLASQASDGITGKLISAVWDPWKKFPDYIAELNSTDIYTLRRITPEDREKNWGGPL